VVSGPVGILALQGGYQRHAALLTQLGASAREVRSAADLEDCAALVLPGGESTAMSRLLQATDLFSALQAFASVRPVFGTCAGLILMGRSDDPQVPSLGLLDVRLVRNAYGRQAQSFQCSLNLNLGDDSHTFPGLFIRAPQIAHTGPGITVLASHAGRPVLVAQGLHMGASFHPELTDDPRIHRHWLARVAAASSLRPRDAVSA